MTDRKRIAELEQEAHDMRQDSGRQMTEITCLKQDRIVLRQRIAELEAQVSDREIYWIDCMTAKAERIAQLEENNKDWRKANEIISADNIHHEQRIAQLELALADYERRWTYFLRNEPEQGDLLGALDKENVLLKERIAQLEECLRAHPDRLIGPPDLLEWEEQKDALLAKGAKE